MLRHNPIQFLFELALQSVLVLLRVKETLLLVCCALVCCDLCVSFFQSFRFSDLLIVSNKPTNQQTNNKARTGVSLGTKHLFGWVRPGLPVLNDLAGPSQDFKSAILDAWRDKVSADLCAREGFRGGPLLDVTGSLQLLTSSHVRERDKALLRGVLVRGVWNGFLLEGVRGQPLPCRFCGGPDGVVHLFGEMYLSSSC